MRWEQRVSIDVATVCAPIAWWASIVLAATPYVTAGALCGAFVARYISRGHGTAALLLLGSPGCDCSGSGYAPALARRSSPPLAGFIIVWCAAAGPSALIATHAALGSRLLFARVAGAAVASSLTAFGWWASRTSRDKVAHACLPSAHEAPLPLAVVLRHALLSVGVSAAAATLLLGTGLSGFLRSASPFAASIAGALLSPCATADALIARVLLHEPAARAAFLIASQCADLRQMTTIGRSFGAGRAAIALVAAAIGSAVAALLAR